MSEIVKVNRSRRSDGNSSSSSGKRSINNNTKVGHNGMTNKEFKRGVTALFQRQRQLKEMILDGKEIEFDSEDSSLDSEDDMPNLVGKSSDEDEHLILRGDSITQLLLYIPIMLQISIMKIAKKAK